MHEITVYSQLFMCRLTHFPYLKYKTAHNHQCRLMAFISSHG